MELIIFALLVNSVTSQTIPRIAQCNGLRCAPIQRVVAMPSDCYRKSFGMSLPAGAVKCASMREQNAETLPAGGLADMTRRTVGALLGTVGAGMLFDSRPAAAAGDIDLVTFSSKPGKWNFDVDPATSGNSKGSIDIKDGVLNLNGYCQYRPFLTQKREETSGYLKADTTDNNFPDVSSCEGISIVARQTGVASVKDEANAYEGYKFCIGGNRGATAGKLAKRNRLGSQCYKTPINVPQGEFGTIQVPFTEFSNFWDAETGNIVRTCAASPKSCPDAATLQNMQDMSFWAEGFQGNVNLEVKSVSAYGCSAVSELATRDRARNSSFLWLPAAGSLGGLLLIILVRTRTKPTPTAPPLLG